MVKLAHEESGLDALDPAVHRSQDAAHLREIVAARKAIADGEARLHRAVAAAREAGDSWAVIGMALDTTRQAAYQRFGQRT